ncbi:MAG: class C sortase [Lachnospiraceae bacterium]|jgi:sortase A|nr:class C sortase [Lachnospiraceae bacterium]
MKKHLGKLLIILLFLAGFSLLLYPFVANQWNNYRQRRLMGSFDEAVAQREAAGEIDYEAEWAAAAAYNEALLPSILPDSFAAAEGSEEDKIYMSCLNVGGNGVMGAVEIPKIGISLPIFHTTKEELLQMAAGHLEGSSLPVGGPDTHTVVSAHRGLPSASLFTDLDKMEEGDHFLFHILNETLCYEIDLISVVEPEDTDVLQVEEGEDLATLMTCTPYGVNSHRLMVRGHRVPYEAEAVASEKLELADMSLHTNYLLWVAVGVVITGVFSFILYRRERKLKKKAAKARGDGEKSLPDEEPAKAVFPEDQS